MKDKELPTKNQIKKIDQNKKLTPNINKIQKINTTKVQNSTVQVIPAKNASIPNMRVCLCTHAKKDINYLREYAKFYLNLGVDKIYIYNRNKKGGEETSFRKPLRDLRKTGKVVIEDWRGKGNLILDMMNHCYQMHYKHYDWIIFYEPDEFIHLKGITNIKTFLGAPKFAQCKKIYLNWVIHTDNELYHYEDKPVQLRFPKTMPKPDPKNIEFNIVKSIIRGKQENVTFECLNRLNKRVDGCNGNGKIAKMDRYRMKEPDFENFYIDHYFSRSVDEFIKKYDEEDLKIKETHFKDDFTHYFKINKIDDKKIKYIEEKTKLDLSKYKLKDPHNKKSK
jgi:hypothetical protein